MSSLSFLGTSRSLPFDKYSSGDPVPEVLFLFSFRDCDFSPPSGSASSPSGAQMNWDSEGLVRGTYLEIIIS